MPDLTVTLVQADLAWEDPAANREALGRRLADVPPGADLVVLPEMFSTGFTMEGARVAEAMDGPTPAWMRLQAQHLGAVLAGSAVIRTKKGLFNRFLWVPPEGPVGIYDKRHLFRMAGEHQVYRAGRRPFTAVLKGWRIRPVICYDLRFPIWCRSVGAGYDLLLVVANWPAARREHWQALLVARAIENQAWVVAVNRVGRDGRGLEYSGDSLVVDPWGTIRYRRTGDAAADRVQLSRAALEECRSTFEFWKDADDELAAPLKALSDGERACGD